MSRDALKIADVFEVARGGSPRPIQDFITDDPEGVNWIMIGDTEEGSKFITKTKKRIRREGVSKSRVVHSGDFLLTNSMSFGRPYILKTDGCIHDGWLVLSPKSDKVSPDYFYYYLGSPEIKRKLAQRAAGAVVKNLNSDIVRDLEILVPPMEEQKRIAAILDKADAIRRKRQQAIQLADEFLRSVFLEMFGDLFTTTGYANARRKTIRDLVDYIDYRGKTPEKSSSGVPLITAKNVKKGYVSIDPQEFIPEKNYESWMTRGKPMAGDVLFTTEAPLGNAALLGEYERVAVGQRLVVLRGRGEVTQEYLLFTLLNPFVQGLIDGRSSGSTAKGIRTAELYRVELPVPPLDLQQRFTSVFNAVTALKRRLEGSASESVTLFASLSQRAFQGGL